MCFGFAFAYDLFVRVCLCLRLIVCCLYIYRWLCYGVLFVSAVLSLFLIVLVLSMSIRMMLRVVVFVMLASCADVLVLCVQLVYIMFVYDVCFLLCVESVVYCVAYVCL